MPIDTSGPLAAEDGTLGRRMNLDAHAFRLADQVADVRTLIGVLVTTAHVDAVQIDVGHHWGRHRLSQGHRQDVPNAAFDERSATNRFPGVVPVLGPPPDDTLVSQVGRCDDLVHWPKLHGPRPHRIEGHLVGDLLEPLDVPIATMLPHDLGAVGLEGSGSVKQRLVVVGHTPDFVPGVGNRIKGQQAVRVRP